MEQEDRYSARTLWIAAGLFALVAFVFGYVALGVTRNGEGWLGVLLSLGFWFLTWWWVSCLFGVLWALWRYKEDRR